MITTDATASLAADVMCYIARNGETQRISNGAPVSLDSPIKTVSGLNYVTDLNVEDADDGYSSPSIRDDSYAYVSVRNHKGEVFTRRMHGSMNEILASVLASSVTEVAYED